MKVLITENKDKLYNINDEVPTSGIYVVVHDTKHSEQHEVTCVKGERFPPLRNCGDKPQFKLVRAAHHISEEIEFKKQ